MLIKHKKFYMLEKIHFAQKGFQSNDNRSKYLGFQRL